MMSGLDCYAKQGGNESCLGQRVALTDPLHSSLANHMHCFNSPNRLPCTVERAITFRQPYSLFDRSMVLLNGLITNDKFCLIRIIRQKLRYVRRQRGLPCKVTDSCEYPRDEGHRGG